MSMATKVSAIEGIGPKYQEKLAEAGISTVEGLLDAACTPKGRQELADKSGIDKKRILAWAGMADMFRIKGVASQFAELLKAAGVDTIKELRTRKAENLQQKMAEVNAEKKLTRAVPRLEQVEDFIAQAKELSPKMSY